MNQRKLNKLKAEKDRLWRGSHKAAEFESLASKLGRKTENRGKEPTWVSAHFALRPLAIPHHGGKDLPIGTARSILGQLDDDIIAWEERLDSEGEDDGTDD